MPKTNGTNEHDEANGEMNLGRLTRNYDGQVLNDDQAGVDVEWHEEDNQDIVEPTEAVLIGGDIDADFKEANAGEDEVTDESDPTPDQDVVDEIGKAVGLTYEDAEPLRPEDKITKRDEERWELNPVSSEDYEERQTREAGEP